MDKVLIFDFGGQYCHLIARRIREFNVYAEVVSPDSTVESIKNVSGLKGIILSGGAASVYDHDAPKFYKDILGLGIPILGICYGHQLIAHLTGGKVVSGKRGEYGVTKLRINKTNTIFKNCPSEMKVWMSHKDVVQRAGKDYEILASTDNTPIAAFVDKKKIVFGVQFHPEVAHTENGGKILKNFIFDTCRVKPDWRMEDFIENSIKEIRESIGDKKAIIGLSGGIDSSTTTILAAKAIGRNLVAVFVDHGFMRESEVEFINNTFKKFNFNLISINARKRFLEKLTGVTDPEQKRKIIGEEFIRVFEEVAMRVRAEYLLQGTIYPDRIESGFRKHSEKIKTHHNVAGLPIKVKFKKIIEPLRDLYKDEVRKIAKKLGLPVEIASRQPFPGPGLAVRIIGKITPEKIEIIRKADEIVTQEIEKSNLNKNLWQYFAVLTDTKSTGVKGDSRAYGHTVAIRAVESKEAMTAGFARIPYDILEKISTRITNEIPQVTRVIYDITHKPPATIEWE